MKRYLQFISSIQEKKERRTKTKRRKVIPNLLEDIPTTPFTPSQEFALITVKDSKTAPMFSFPNIN